MCRSSCLVDKFVPECLLRNLSHTLWYDSDLIPEHLKVKLFVMRERRSNILNQRVIEIKIHLAERSKSVFSKFGGSNKGCCVRYADLHYQ